MAEQLDQLRAALAERYTIERELGRGGMATVYLAQDLKHNRRVAVKVLRSDLAAALGADRFGREIEIAARLSHPHILSLHESGAAAGFLYYVMPFVDGESLRDRLRRDGHLPIEDALQITVEVADALGYAHDQGVIHRDIKPENILLSGGHAIVADFGIARALSAAGGQSLTETGLALGTPAYMSPEQGSGSRAVDARSDLYSLACVLYEMLAGHPPFLGSTAHEVLARHALDAVPPLRTGRTTVPVAVEQATVKALAKVPADRYSSVAQFAHALTSPSPAPTAPGASLRRRQLRPWALGGVMLGLGLLLVLGFRIWGSRSARNDAGNLGQVRSLAVLPLESSSGDSTLGAELTEALGTNLGRVSGLRVTAQSAVARNLTSALSVQQIARNLGVDAALAGRLRRSGDRLTVDLQLIGAATGKELWARHFDESVQTRFSLQGGIARSLVNDLKLTVTSVEERTLRSPPTSNPEAWDLFLRARIHARTETQGEASTAIGLFERAVALDPGFAAAYAGLAYAHGIGIFYHHPRDEKALETAMVAAEKALRLGPDLAEAHFARAFLLWMPAAHFAHEQAIQEFRRANELNPNLPEAHDWLGVVYWHIGLLDKAAEEFRQVLVIDPGNRLAEDRKAMILVYRQQYEEAVRVLRPIPRNFNPSLETYDFVWALVLANRDEEASTVIEDYLQRHADAGGLMTAVRAIIRAKAGDKRGAESDIKKAELEKGFGHFHHTAFSIASTYALLQQPGLVVEWLRRTIADGLPCYPLLAADPNLANVRKDPGFVALLAELKVQWERWKATL